MTDPSSAILNWRMQHRYYDGSGRLQKISGEARYRTLEEVLRAVSYAPCLRPCPGVDHYWTALAYSAAGQIVSTRVYTAWGTGGLPNDPSPQDLRRAAEGRAAPVSIAAPLGLSPQLLPGWQQAIEVERRHGSPAPRRERPADPADPVTALLAHRDHAAAGGSWKTCPCPPCGRLQEEAL